MADLRKLVARLLSECAAKVAPRVRIPVSPPIIKQKAGSNTRNRLSV